jgi:O-antigen/teichoic acid export membrane protein
MNAVASLLTMARGGGGGGSLLRLIGSSAFRDVTALGFGTVLSQGILIIGAPVFLRLYQPADFGLYSLAYGWIMLIALLTTWKIDRLIVVVPDRFTALRLLASLAVLAAGAAVVVLAVAAVAGPVIGRFTTEVPSGVRLLWLAPFSGLAFSIMTGFRSYSIRLQKFRLVSTAQIMRAGIFVAGSVLTALVWDWKAGSGALVILSWQIIADTAALSLHIAGNRPAVRVMVNRLGVRRSIGVLPVHVKTLGVLATSELLGALNQQIAVSVAMIAFGATAAGWYSFAMLAVGTPSSIVASAVSDVFNQRVASLHAKRRPFASVVLTSTLVMALAGILPFTLIALLAQPALALVMGAKWVGAHVSITILAVSNFFCFVSAVPGNIPLIVGARRFLLLWQASRLACMAALAAAAVLGPIGYVAWLAVKVAIDSAFYVVEIAAGPVFAHATEAEWRAANPA